VAEGSHLVTFDWDFGDGTTANGVDVSHVYNSPGAFAVTLKVVDDKGLSDSTVHQIQIDDRPATPQPDQPPIPVIDAPSQARVGDTITFDSSRSTSANPIVRNVWEFGDGARVDNAVKAQHAYGQAGVYRVKLTVEDNQGLKSEAYHQIEISAVQPEPTSAPDQPPTARINAPASVKVGESFIVDAANSGCATTCVSYAWDMGDGTQANAVTFQHAYGGPGDYNITLVVTDDQGLQGMVNQLIRVTAEAAQQPPTAVINGPTLAAVGEPVNFSSSSQPGSGGPIIEYLWEFGDGNRDNSGPAVTYTYASPGAFIVRLTVSDAQGQGSTADWPIQISAAVEAPPAPTEELSPEQLPAEQPEGQSQ
jgi:PKD repeat protein